MRVETKRMLLQPMSDSEIEEMMAEMHSDDLRAAYGEMLAGCRREPENRIWYAPWKMTLKNSREYMGDVGFKGPAKNRTVEIGYGILPSYEGNGYMAEAVQGMIRWAFAQQDVDFVEAETDPDNRASQRILEKCGFVPNGKTGEEGPRFVVERPQTT